MERSRAGWRRWLGIVGWALMVLACAGFFVHVWQKIASGNGLDTYFTGFGVQFNYIGAAVLIAILPIVLLAAALLNWWHGREERDFKRRYSRNDGPR